MPGETDKNRFLSKGKIFTDKGNFLENAKKPAPDVSSIQTELTDFWQINIDVHHNKKMDSLIRDSMVVNNGSSIERKYLVENPDCLVLCLNHKNVEESRIGHYSGIEDCKKKYFTVEERLDMSEYLFTNWELANDLYVHIGNKKNIHDEEMFLDAMNSLPEIIKKIGYKKDSKLIDLLKTDEESYRKIYNSETLIKGELKAKMQQNIAGYSLHSVIIKAGTSNAPRYHALIRCDDNFWMTTDGPTVEMKTKAEAWKEINEMGSSTLYPELLFYTRDSAYDDLSFTEIYKNYRALLRDVKERMQAHGQQHTNNFYGEDNLTKQMVRTNTNIYRVHQFKELDYLQISEGYLRMFSMFKNYDQETANPRKHQLLQFFNCFFYAMKNIKGTNDEYLYKWQLIWEWSILMGRDLQITEKNSQDNYYVLQNLFAHGADPQNL